MNEGFNFLIRRKLKDRPESQPAGHGGTLLSAERLSGSGSEPPTSGTHFPLPFT
jgi:hypothetical protein